MSPANILPYAGDRPWATLFKMEGNIISLETITDAEAYEWYAKIEELLEKSAIPTEQDYVLEEFESILNQSKAHARVNTPAGRFWYVTFLTSRLLSEESDYFSSKWENKTPVNWNLLFRLIGIDGIVDPGLGIIHDNEPTQAVCFSKKSIKATSRAPNKYSPDDMKTSEIKRKLNTASDEEKFNLLKSKPVLISFIRNPDKSFILKCINDAPANSGLLWAAFNKMKDDTDVQYAAIKRAPDLIRKIKNPNDDLIELVREIDPSQLKWIKT